MTFLEDVLMPGKTNDAEQFLKTEELGALSGKHKGFAADIDPKLHRPIRKALEPFFTTKAIKSWKEPLFHQHFDLFIEKITAASVKGPVNLKQVSYLQSLCCRSAHTSSILSMLTMFLQWVEWVSMDLAGDMAFGHNYGNLRDGRSLILFGFVLD